MRKYPGVARELMVVERAAWWNPLVRRVLKAAPLVVMFLLLNTRAARAACSFSPTPDPTADGSPKSLRHAIIAANASGQNCSIQLLAGTYTLTIKNTSGQDNTGAQGDLDITASGHTVTILGKGAGVSIINGNGIDRVFQVLGGANAAFSNLTIEGSVAQGDGAAGALPGTTESEGGGLLVQDGGHVTLSGVWVQGDQAIGGKGAGVVCTSRRTATESGAPGQPAAGGGLFVSSGVVDLTNSKVYKNIAMGGQGGKGGNCGEFPHGGGAGGAAAGGGLSILSGGASLVGSTVSANSVAGGEGGAGTGGGAGGLGAGGGLYVLSANVGLSESSVSGNRATGASGGEGGCYVCSGGVGAPDGNGGAAQGAGLFIAAGALKLGQTTVSGNSATGGMAGSKSGYSITGPNGSGGSSSGAGIFVASGSVSLANSTFFANEAKGGSGVYHKSCAICSNTPGQGGDAAGGGLYFSGGSISLAGLTLASNQALATTVEATTAPPGMSSGGGIANAGAKGLVANTTLIGNNTQDSGSTNNGNDVSGAITSLYSLMSDTAGATITNDGGNIFNQDPGLDPDGLKSNGGPTQTVALEQGSLADGRGDNSICKEAAPTGLGGIDQRGLDRFRPGDELCDIGAFEFVTLLVQPFAPASLSFGSEAVGKQSPYQNVSVTNNQTTSVTLNKSISGADPADFIVIGSCHSSLASQASCTISIAFHPKASGTRTAQLAVTDSPDPTSPYGVTLSGKGT